MENETPLKEPPYDADGCSSYTRMIWELLLQDSFESCGPAPSSKASETALNVVRLLEYPYISASRDMEKQQT